MKSPLVSRGTCVRQLNERRDVAATGTSRMQDGRHPARLALSGAGTSGLDNQIRAREYKFTYKKLFVETGTASAAPPPGITGDPIHRKQERDA
ncbi:hypothetical protein [Burkholderia multivorans]|uniref:hypothetical protein n=1 Tax=Burkholderia multivorans TaxID=87883 RepID=UPI001561FE40|nr:hypothetical protein [Burkholderia multivorans]MCA8439372.1 hypothetical protein [Burkholderia multivorans]